MIGLFKIPFELTKLSLQHYYHYQKHKVRQLSALFSCKQVYCFSNNNENQQSKDSTLKENQQKQIDLPNDCLKEHKMNSVIKDLGQQAKHFVTKEQILKLFEQKQRKNQQKIQKQEKQGKKQKEDQKARMNNFRKFWKLYKEDLVAGIIIFGGIFGGLGGFIYFFWFQYWWSERILIQKKIKKQQEIKAKYGNQQLKVQSYYTQNNEVEQQLENLIDQNSNKKVIVIGGTSGLGKTTSIKEIANKRRKNGENFFYFSFRDQNEQAIKVTPKLIKQFEDFIILVHSIAYDTSKKTTLVIDDINKLKNQDQQIMNKAINENMGQRIANMNQITKLLCDAARNGNLKVLTISSSSKFVNELKKNNFLSKEGQFIILQPKSKHDMEKSISNILEHFFPNKQFEKIKTQIDIFRNQAKQYMLEQGHNLRDIVQFMKKANTKFSNYLKNQQTEVDVSKIPSIVSILKKFEDDKKQDLIDEIRGIFKQFDTKFQYSPAFLKVLANYKFPNQEIKRKDCLKVQIQIDSIKNVKQESVKQILNKLDQSNIIVYCHPRSAFLRNVLKKTMQTMKIQNK